MDQPSGPRQGGAPGTARVPLAGHPACLSTGHPACLSTGVLPTTLAPAGRLIANVGVTDLCGLPPLLVRGSPLRVSAVAVGAATASGRCSSSRLVSATLPTRISRSRALTSAISVAQSRPDWTLSGTTISGRLETVDDLAVNARLEESLDGIEEGPVFGRHQRDGGARLAGSTRPADPMHVILGHDGELEV